MRITYILDTFTGGGKERRCLQLIQGLNKQGYNDIQVIIVNNNVAYQELYDTSAEVHIINRKELGLGLWDTTKQIKALLKCFSPDIVQSWGGISTLLSVLIKPSMHFKLVGAFVANADRPKSFHSKIYNKLYISLCDKIVGNSLAGLKAYGIPKSKAVLIYNGLNESRLNKLANKEKVRKELEIHTPYVVAMIARFTIDKDWSCYLNAAKRIVSERQDITFLAIGDGPTWHTNRTLISDNENKLIKLTGRRDDVDEILQICDISVLTSHHGEGVSNSIMESMAFGVPVIATNKGGTPEIISDGENGYLIGEGEVKELSDKILAIIDDSSVHRCFSKKAAEAIRERFLLTQMTNKFISCYLELCRK